MSRLTERQSAGYDLIEMKGAWCDNYCGEQSKATCRDCAIWKAIQKLAHYEDLEEQGRLIEIVKCSECEHFDTDGCSEGCGWCDVWNIGRFEDGYCDKARLKELKGE